jgi:membrane associated rhomboid family serine protease
MTPAPVGYQCPECVREARKTSPRSRVRVRFILGRPGSVTTALLVLNIAMFLVEIVFSGGGGLAGGPNNAKLFQLGALFPPAIAKTAVLPEHHQYWRLITAMFLHAGLLHLALNMYALYLFGYLIENAFGPARFLSIYFVSGFIASVTSFAFGPVGEVGVGASGAIFGLLGAWVAYNYRRRGSAMASANLRGALMIIVLNAVLAAAIPQIDWRAHLGGLLAGAIAGALAEGVGPRDIRPFVQTAGLILLVLAGVGLAAWRVATFPSLAGIG